MTRIAGTTLAARRARVAYAEERGAGTVLAVGIVATVVVMTVLLAPLAGVALARQNAAGAADAAALAAADVASGAAPGEVCTTAERVAAANGAELEDCSVIEAVVTVTASVAWLGLHVTVRARAGPPGVE